MEIFLYSYVTSSGKTNGLNSLLMNIDRLGINLDNFQGFPTEGKKATTTTHLGHCQQQADYFALHRNRNTRQHSHVTPVGAESVR